MDAVAGPKRRASVRYIIGGQVILHTGSPDSCGDLVNIGPQGILIRTNVQVPEGTELRIGFTVEGYPTPLQGDGQVVGFQQDLMAMKFLGEPAELIHLLQWLSRENIPWTGLDSLDADKAALLLAASSDEKAPFGTPAANQELEAILPFLEAMG